MAYKADPRFVATILSATLWTGVASAQSEPNGPGVGCGNFSLASTGEARVVTHVDAPPEGLSAGDQRIGVRSFIDDNGEEIARLRFIETNLDPVPGDRRIGHVKSYVVFDDGVLIYEHVYEHGVQFDDVSQFTTSSGVRHITVGLGKYAGASGLITIDKADDLSEVFNFDIECRG